MNPSTFQYRYPEILDIAEEIDYDSPSQRKSCVDRGTLHQGGALVMTRLISQVASRHLGRAVQQTACPRLLSLLKKGSISKAGSWDQIYE